MSFSARQTLCRALVKSGDGERAMAMVESMVEIEPLSDLPEYEKILIYALSKDHVQNPKMALNLCKALPEDAEMTRFKWITKAVGYVSCNELADGERCLAEASKFSVQDITSDPFQSDQPYFEFVRKAIRFAKAQRAKSPI